MYDPVMYRKSISRSRNSIIFGFGVRRTALKIAIANYRSIGQGTHVRIIGRDQGYHGVGFDGISGGRPCE
ncbi:beta alanine--pyruvate transaminase domain-containing protein (plasmid) [Rhizobium gallicum bv. gallicum R602sp]|uniref:Beta alanine--pyruvate transaminase domain-containing protein n=1 Tax=Rhizobium gallicum bv. gallicum R602sp TaxID=1041138 RepID=A0A0B4XB76_9HYPH|nr:beta alanine--pyruvate transaminase domain-containing protein [Rhizobium gallicum bv. gallicum R602sp]